MKNTILLCILAGQAIFTPLTPAFANSPASYLNNEIIDWKSDEIKETLMAELRKSPSQRDRATFEVMLVLHLIAADNPSSLNESQILAQSVMQSAPEAWQRAWAQVGFIAALGLRGEYDRQLEHGLVAISSIDFDELKKSSDPDFTKLLHATGAKLGDMEDGLRLMIANCYLRDNELEKANAYVDGIKNPAIGKNIKKQIKFHENQKFNQSARSTEASVSPNSPSPSEVSMEVNSVKNNSKSPKPMIEAGATEGSHRSAWRATVGLTLVAIIGGGFMWRRKLKSKSRE